MTWKNWLGNAPGRWLPTARWARPRPRVWLSLRGKRRRRNLSNIFRRHPRATGDDDLWNSGKSAHDRSEEHTSELQSLMRISYAVFCLKKKKKRKNSRE